MDGELPPGSGRRDAPRPPRADVSRADAPGAALRVDAERNRERILAAALRLLTDRGLEVPLEDIAREAGVGIATLYRRFPTRSDLVSAIYERKIAQYTTAVERALENPDPWAGFCWLIHELCAVQAGDAALKDLLTMNFPASTVVEELSERASEHLDTLIGRAKESGRLREDFDATDLLLVLLGNAAIVTATEKYAPGAWRRFAAYMVAAFSAENPSSLPEAPSRESLREALSHLNQLRN